MKSTNVKLSSKSQITIPKSIRKELDIGPGDVVTLFARDGELVIRPCPASMAEYMRGLGKELWEKAGGADEYIKRERESWEQKSY